MRASVALLCLILLSGCVGGGRERPPETVGEVDLARYQGTWYELARLPMFFQRDCLRSEAHYQLQANGKVAVTNRCETEDGNGRKPRARRYRSRPVAPIDCGCASITGLAVCSRI